MQKITRIQDLFQKEVADQFNEKNNHVEIIDNKAVIVSGKDQGVAFTFAYNSSSISFNEFNLDADMSADIPIDTFISALINHKLIYDGQ